MISRFRPPLTDDERGQARVFLLAALIVFVVFTCVALCRAPAHASRTRTPRTPQKCGQLLVRAMWQAPGAVLQPAPSCLALEPMVKISPRFEVRQNPNPLVADLFYRGRRLGSVVLPPTRPAPAIAFIDKRPRPFATRRRVEAGVEFVEVVPGDLPPLIAKKELPQ